MHEKEQVSVGHATSVRDVASGSACNGMGIMLVCNGGRVEAHVSV